MKKRLIKQLNQPWLRLSTIMVCGVALFACSAPQVPTGPRVTSASENYRVIPPSDARIIEGVPLNEASANSQSTVGAPGAHHNIDSNLPNGYSLSTDSNGVADNTVENISNNSAKIAEQAVERAQNIPQNSGNAAVKALLNDAVKAVDAKQLDRAASSLERAVRIEPNNAGIWHDLAQIRLHQGRFQEAERLAEKSVGLAVGNAGLTKRNYQLMASAKKARGDQLGAELIEQKMK